MTQPKLTGLDDGPPGSIVKRKGDHKRKARPIAPATVTVRAGEITVVVPDVLGKNASHQSGRYLSPQTKRYRASVDAGVGPLKMSQLKVTDWGTHGHAAATGAWRVELLGVWPDQRRTIKGRPADFTPCPEGDADATPAQALDALQHAGILDDDARVTEVRAWNMYRKGERWTVIRLVRVPDLAERDAAIAHLVAMLPPPATPPIEPKPRTKAAHRKAKETVA